mmetsp:Transcript_23139/g.57211  ORF Transcript_23139/g.57211 Transcript_23139/m.57211 type:complete len:394 (-) Transcript_23139:73-1254(-)
MINHRTVYTWSVCPAKGQSRSVQRYNTGHLKDRRALVSLSLSGYRQAALFPLQLHTEHLSKAVHQQSSHPLSRHPVPHALPHGPHRPVADAARHNAFKVGHVGVHVERHTVHRHPLAHPHTDGSHLAALHPHARQPLDSLAFDAQPLKGADDDLLERPQVPVEVLLVVPEVHNGVEHQLSRAVVGHLTATLSAEDRDWVVVCVVACSEYVVFGAGSAQREDRGVLQQDGHVTPSAAIGRQLIHHCVHQPVLQVPARLVRHRLVPHVVKGTVADLCEATMQSSRRLPDRRSCCRNSRIHPQWVPSHAAKGMAVDTRGRRWLVEQRRWDASLAAEAKDEGGGVTRHYQEAEKSGEGGKWKPGTSACSRGALVGGPMSHCARRGDFISSNKTERSM